MPVIAPTPVFAAIAIPTAAQCLMVLGPIAGIFFFGWLLRHLDRGIHRAFPSLAWERELGWLNIRTERQVAAFFRWMGYFVYALLAAALAGIAWGAIALRDIGQWSDPDVLGNLTMRMPVLLLGLGLWMIYLGLELIPKLRREYEREELEKFRVQMAALEEQEEGGRRRAPGGHVPLQIWSKSPRRGPSDS
jgi:hypothetical protein